MWGQPDITKSDQIIFSQTCKNVPKLHFQMFNKSDNCLKFVFYLLYVVKFKSNA